MLFRKGDQAALTFQPVQAGFLYLLDDGPMPDGSLVINILRPAPGVSAGIPAGQRVRIPSDPEEWLHFDDAKGEEKVYLIFSAKPVAELEAIKDQESVVSDEPRLASLRGFLAGHVLASSGIKKDEDAKKTVLSTNDSLLVHRIRLQHH